MHANSFNRRELAKRLGMTGAAFFLPIVRPRAARAATVPKRLIIFYARQGMLSAPFRPIGAGGGAATESDWRFSPYFEALAPFRDKINLLSGVYYSARHLGAEGTGHDQGDQHALSCFPPAGKKAGGPSIDQFIAQQINKPNPVTLLPSANFVVGLKDDASVGEQRTGTYVAAASPTPLEDSMVRAYRRLFPGGPPDPMDGPPAQAAADAERSREQRRQVLQFASNQYAKVASAVERQGAAGRLAVHGDLIRDLEKRLTTFSSAPVPSGTCKIEMPGDSNKFLDRADGFSRMVQAAFACDITRVAFLSMGFPPGYLWNGPSYPDMHQLFHSVDAGTTLQGNTLTLQRGVTVLAKAYAQLLARLHEVPQADGSTLLDNTAVLWTQELTTGNHSYRNGKWMLAGSLGGRYRTGRFIDKTGGDYFDKKAMGIASADVFTALAQGMGVNVDKYGDPRAGNGALPELS